MLVAAYRELIDSGAWEENPDFLASIRMKPVRTLSGVTTVTVLTKPYPCPEMHFCPLKTRCPRATLRMNQGSPRFSKQVRSLRAGQFADH